MQARIKKNILNNAIPSMKNGRTKQSAWVGYSTYPLFFSCVSDLVEIDVPRFGRSPMIAGRVVQLPDGVYA